MGRQFANDPVIIPEDADYCPSGHYLHTLYHKLGHTYVSRRGNRICRLCAMEAASFHVYA